MYIPVILPAVLRAADALYHIGVTQPAAVRSIAETWRDLQVTDAFTWQQARDANVRTIEHLEHAGLLRRQPQATYATLVNGWIAPLFPLDLTPLNVDAVALRDAQEHWVPPDAY
jgi:hypothetical protein